ncbi:AAA-16 domain-containing protein [Phanerochaete sordida]|uniref:AAA-16 domain-containing protein n=1 Tax=Phanerochaete sordida TaxID=48140 RepID=A0A9P3LH22_9APHY|nr:AAA-16 domain-containing protein [Phanerochaete sordida]
MSLTGGLFRRNSLQEVSREPALAPVVDELERLTETVKATQEGEERRSFLSAVRSLARTMHKSMKVVQGTVEAYEGKMDDKHDLMKAIMLSDELQGRIQDLLSTVEDLKEHAQGLTESEGLRGYIKGVWSRSANQTILKDMKRILARAVDSFEHDLAVDIERIRDNFQAMKSMQRQFKRAESGLMLIESIPRVPAGYRLAHKYKRGFLDGTREGPFEAVNRWLGPAGQINEHDMKRFYLLTGWVGSGKSTIAHQLCLRVERGQHASVTLGASFFFARGNSKLESSQYFFSTIAQQLAVAIREIRPYFIDAARVYFQGKGIARGQSAFEALLRTPLAAASASFSTPTVIVVDGIDECRDRNQLPELLQALLALVREFPWLYIFATSRPEPYILSVLASADSADIVHHARLDDTIHDVSGDLGRYIEHSTTEIPPYAEYFREHPDALERLVEYTGGIFLVARIAVRFLDAHQDDPEEGLELLFSEDGRALFPLDAVYLQVLQSAFPLDELRISCGQHERIRSLLRTIALVPGYATPELIALLDGDIQVPQVMSMLDRLRSLLIVDTRGRIIPLHSSFRAFLLDEQRCKNRICYVNRPKGHAHLAAACLRVISSSQVAKMLMFPLTAAAQARARLGYNVMTAWHQHLVQAEFDPELERQLSKFVGGIQLAVYAWTSEPAEVIRAGQAIMEYLEPSPSWSTICAQYFKLSSYAQLWRAAMVESSSSQPPDIISIDIFGEIHRGFGDAKIPRDFDLHTPAVELIRYRGVMGALAGQVRLWDTDAQEIWYSEGIVDIFKAQGSSSKRRTVCMSMRRKGTLVLHEAQVNLTHRRPSISPTDAFISA